MNQFDLSKLTVIHNVSSHDRKTIHKYLDTKVHKTSVHLSNLDAEKIAQTVKCNSCNHKCKFVKENYSEEIYPDSSDYYYFKYCAECNNLLVYDPYKTDKENDIKTVYRHNCILIGDILSGYCQPKHTITEVITDDEFNQALRRSIVYTISNPDDDCLHKHRIIRHANQCVLWQF